MRSVTRGSKTRDMVVSGSSFTPTQTLDVLNSGAEIVKSVLNLLGEVQKTKQISYGAKVRITESDNKLKYHLAEFQKDMYRMQGEYELASQKLDNEHNINMRKLDMMEKMIEHNHSIEAEILRHQDEAGLTSPHVMRLFEQLHQQTLSLSSNTLLLGDR
ncbi:MAG: hypothetical protein JJW00_04305 [Sulfurimonas sp.]|nr:hypothetical protein [Sulfurimonas sp.]